MSIEQMMQRLTISVIKTACQQGAIAFNHAEVKEFTYNHEGIIDGINLLIISMQKAYSSKQGGY